MAAFLPYRAYELLNHEFAQFTLENSVELMRGDKQRNRENLNFKSVAAAISLRRSLGANFRAIQSQLYCGAIRRLH